jgi:hypothetical protein
LLSGVAHGSEHFRHRLLSATGRRIGRGQALKHDVLRAQHGLGNCVKQRSTRLGQPQAARTTVGFGYNPLQIAARFKLGNHFAVLGPITKVADFAAIGPQRIHLAVNGAVKQEAHLSGYYHLQPGDIIMTGTPAGVGAVVSTCRLRSDV